MRYFPKYVIAGVINTLAGYLVIFFLMYLMQCSPETSNLLGYGLGVISSYFLNRNFTFKSNRIKSKEFIRFFIVFIIAYTVNFLILVLLTHQFKIHLGLSQILAGIAYICVSFFLNKYYVFFERIAV